MVKNMCLQAKAGEFELERNTGARGRDKEIGIAELIRRNYVIRPRNCEGEVLKNIGQRGAGVGACERIGTDSFRGARNGLAEGIQNNVITTNALCSAHRGK